MTIYYQDDRVTLHHGKAEDVLPTLPVGLIDVAITDPPYSAKVHGAARSRRMVPANDRGGRYGSDTRRNVNLGFSELTPELREFLAFEFARLVNRWTLVFSDVESCHLWRTDLEEAGLDYVRTLAWHKLGSTPQFSGDRPAVAFETITVAHQPGRKRWNGGGRHGLYAHAIVLDRGRSKDRVHTTQKPLPLMADLISDFTEPDEVVLDATAGSGTTLVAAKRAGRYGIGVEEDEAVCEVAARRLEATGVSLFDAVRDDLQGVLSIDGEATG